MGFIVRNHDRGADEVRLCPPCVGVNVDLDRAREVSASGYVSNAGAYITIYMGEQQAESAESAAIHISMTDEMLDGFLKLFAELKGEMIWKRASRPKPQEVENDAVPAN